jgi:hypothetical protein
MTVGAQDAPLPFNLTDLDRQILAQTDEEFHPHSWDELKQIIGKLFRRMGPSQI